MWDADAAEPEIENASSISVMLSAHPSAFDSDLKLIGSVAAVPGHDDRSDCKGYAHVWGTIAIIMQQRLCYNRSWQETGKEFN